MTISFYHFQEKEKEPNQKHMGHEANGLGGERGLEEDCVGELVGKEEAILKSSEVKDIIARRKATHP